MVVQHDHVAGRGGGQRLVAERAAIDADDQLMLLRQRGDGGDVGAIAFVDTVGDIQRRLAPLLAQPVDQQRGRGAAIDIVIGKDGDALPGASGVGDAGGGRSHVAQAQRIGQQVAQLRLQIACRLVRGNTARGQNAGHGQGQAALLRQGLGGAFKGCVGAAPETAGQR